VPGARGVGVLVPLPSLIAAYSSRPSIGGRSVDEEAPHPPPHFPPGLSQTHDSLQCHTHAGVHPHPMDDVLPHLHNFACPTNGGRSIS
jgi:hypothetical protein